jgi:sugar O-acyltransferase (sialic acid O-acetyltransferase NeuD family)
MRKIEVEQFNVSDDQYKLIEICVENGQGIEKNEVLFCLESSKASLEIEAEGDGFIYINPALQLFDDLKVGTVMAYISPDELLSSPFVDAVKQEEKVEATVSHDESLPEQVRISPKALALIEKFQIPFSVFSGQEFISEKEVLAALRQEDLAFDAATPNATQRIAIIAAGSGAILMINLMKQLPNVEPTVIYDDTPEKQGKRLWGTPIRGKVDANAIKRDFDLGIFDAVIISVGTNNAFRKKVWEMLSDKGIQFTNLIHPNTIIESNTQIGTGNIFLGNNYIGPFTTIGNNCYIAANVSIDHHNQIGNHCTFGPGVMTSGTVTIGNESKFGTGVFIEPKVKIGNNAIIASGCAINFHVPAHAIVRIPEAAKPQIHKN